MDIGEGDMRKMGRSSGSGERGGEEDGEEQWIWGRGRGVKLGGTEGVEAAVEVYYCEKN